MTSIDQCQFYGTAHLLILRLRVRIPAPTSFPLFHIINAVLAEENIVRKVTIIVIGVGFATCHVWNANLFMDVPMTTWAWICGLWTIKTLCFTPFITQYQYLIVRATEEQMIILTLITFLLASRSQVKNDR